MNIAFYAPLKPLGTGPPSGDDATASGMVHFLRAKGHTVTQISELNARLIFQDKAKLRFVSSERQAAFDRARSAHADVWLTFHSYWKAPDLLGPWCCSRLGIPYVLHKGMHAQKRRRSHASLPGFLMNQKALLHADAVFTDDRNDIPALGFLPEHKVCHLQAGIDATPFFSDAAAGDALRCRYGIGAKKIVATAAMLRPGVKAQSVRQLLESLALIPADLDFLLLVAGEGPCREELEALAQHLLPGRCLFLGLCGKEELRAVYSAADVFAFPGIGESLGMVYLEAMCCATPVVAYAGSGPSQLVRDGETGVLVEPQDRIGFAQAVERLLLNDELRSFLSRHARPHILQHHSLSTNLEPLEATMLRLITLERP